MKIGSPLQQRSCQSSSLLTPKLIVRGLLGTLLGLSCAAIVSYFLGVRPDEVVLYLANIPAWAVIACAASSFVVLALQSLRWHAVMNPLLGLRYSQAYRAQVIGVLFNALIPARGGDLLRVQYLGRRTGKSRATILGTEIVDRWLDWWGWIPVILLLAVTDDLPRWAFVAVIIFGGALFSWAVVMVMLTRRGYRPKESARFGKLLGKLQSGIQAFRTNRIWLIAFLIAPLPWLWEASVLSNVSPAFGIHINLAQAFCVLVGFNLATVVPSPGSVGTVDGGSGILWCGPIPSARVHVHLPLRTIATRHYNWRCNPRSGRRKPVRRDFTGKRGNCGR